MAKINSIKNNFTSGEINPLIWLRSELAQYNNGCKTVQNMLPLIEGGIKKRGGTALIKTAANAIRLIPFVVSHKDTYILVFKVNQIEVINASGTVITTLTTSYTEQQIKEITYCQSRYNLWLAHGDKPLSWVRCAEDFSNWAFSVVTFSVPPLEEIDTYPVVLNMTTDIKDVGKVTTLTVQAYETYSDIIQYYIDDIVKVSSNYYRCILDSLNNPVTDTMYWESITVSEATVFTVDSVGKFIFANDGIVRVDTYIDSLSVSGEIIKKFSSTVEVVARAWQIKENIFTAALGYPRTVSYYQQRLVLGGTKKYPNYVWFSRTGDTSNYLPTTTDGDAFTVAAASDSLTNILHLSQSRGVIVHTGGSELLISSSGSLTPTSVEIVEHTAYGTAESIKPIKVGTELIFVQRGSERVRTLAYEFSQDGLASNELSVLASHIPRSHGGIKEMAYAQDPDSIIWYVLNDGSVAALTLNKEQSVTAWSWHYFGNNVSSVCTLPSSTGSDRVYFLVNRNGTIQIEEIRSDLLLDTAKAVTVTHATTATITDSLVGVLGDQVQAYYKQGNVVYQVPIISRVGNTLTLNCGSTVNTIYIGKAFTAKITLLPTDFAQRPTTNLTDLMKIDYLNLVFRDSIAPMVNGELIELETFDDEPLAQPTLFTGIKRIEMAGWGQLLDLEITIEQDKPLPLHITACVLEQSINSR